MTNEAPIIPCSNEGSNILARLCRVDCPRYPLNRTRAKNRGSVDPAPSDQIQDSQPPCYYDDPVKNRRRF